MMGSYRDPVKYTGMTGSYERPGEKFRRICMAGRSPVPVPPLSHYSSPDSHVYEFDQVPGNCKINTASLKKL